TSCMEMILDSLSIWFIQSLSKDLEGISRIYCIPMGDLLAIPFEYGKITDCSMLCEKYEFYRITSEFELCNKSCHISRKVLVCGDVDFRMPISGDVEFQNGFVFRSSKIGKLKYSELSTDSIEQYIKGKTIIILSRQDANEMAFKKLVQDSIDILLIETHGLFLNNYNLVSCEGNNNPMENHALALAGASYALEGGIVPDSIDDGILTAKEISELDLHNVDLAVVSACKSALGEIREDGVYGLMKGFKQAGVRSLIMATDDIVDYVAGQLWIQLFRNLAKGMTKREALLEGLKYIRTMDDGAFSHPKYWTPFILIDGME
ncbi:MAG: CHAT domain-containing protein, partial [Prevotella sp.]